jgi:hypothetical protein
MAFTPNRFLNNNTSTTLRDQQHAARLFSDDQFRLAPKHKFLFHVAFGINPAALKNINLANRHKNEINMLVKSCDLPNYTLKVETLNQYNRKKNVQTGYTLNPINILFHDDNMGVINQLWQNYYSYYYADPTSAMKAGAFGRTATKNPNYIRAPYGLDNGSTLPFFNYITIYQMARHEYVAYTLINPIISAWNHNKVDYSQTGTHDNQMQIQYEAVAYNVGEVSAGDPEGFGLEHYDTSLSPLQVRDSNTDTTSPSFVSNGVATNTDLAALGTLTTQINSYQNTQPLTQGGTAGILPGVIQNTNSSVSGLQGLSFPVSTATTSNTVATQVNLA